MEVDGVGMGVFNDGMPYLTGRGLARICGVDQKAIVQVTSALAQGVVRPREARIAERLEKHGVDPVQPYVIVATKTKRYNAFPAPACLAFIEYYAFEAGSNTKKQAQETYRAFADKGLETYILERIGFDPNAAIQLAWQQSRDRVLASYGGIPSGYFIEFKETSDIIVALRQGAFSTDAKRHALPIEMHSGGLEPAEAAGPAARHRPRPARRRSA